MAVGDDAVKTPAQPSRWSLTFGATAPCISEQLKRQGLKPSGRHTDETVDRCADMITDLYMRGILTEAETRRARDRLASQIKPVRVQVEG